MTPEPGWVTPADLPANASTVPATADKLFSNVILYTQMGKFRLQFIGRSDNCPKYPSGKGILYRESQRPAISQEESRVLDWATNPGTGYRIRADDPALLKKEWKVYPLARSGGAACSQGIAKRRRLVYDKATRQRPSQALSDISEQPPGTPDGRSCIMAVVTISRQYGSGGEEVAQLVCDQLATSTLTRT